eukprot:2159774-Rhodomonas_salina.5
MYARVRHARRQSQYRTWHSRSVGTKPTASYVSAGHGIARANADSVWEDSAACLLVVQDVQVACRVDAWEQPNPNTSAPSRSTHSLSTESQHRQTQARRLREREEKSWRPGMGGTEESAALFAPRYTAHGCARGSVAPHAEEDQLLERVSECLADLGAIARCFFCAGAGDGDDGDDGDGDGDGAPASAAACDGGVSGGDSDTDDTDDTDDEGADDSSQDV